MTSQLIDAGKNPTVPVSVASISGEIVQKVILTDGTDLDPIGTSSNPIISTNNQGTPLASGVGWRITEYGTGGLPNVYFNLFGIWEVPVSVIGDPTTGSPWGFRQGRGQVANTSDTSTRSNKAASTASQLLISSNTNRVGFIILNDSTATLTICYDAAASATSKTAIIPPGQHITDTHTGEVYGIWDTATGDARITEKY